MIINNNIIIDILKLKYNNFIDITIVDTIINEHNIIVHFTTHFSNFTNPSNLSTTININDYNMFYNKTRIKKLNSL